MSIINFKEWCSKEHHGEMYNEKKFLLEINYGALEKDNRIEKLRDILKDCILKRLKERYFNGRQTTIIKDRTHKDCRIILKWNIDSSSQRERHSGICSEVSTAIFLNNVYVLEFKCVKQLGTSDHIYLQELIEFFSSSKSNIYISHEAKHILDSIDKLYTKEDYIKPKKDESNPTQYVSQSHERHNFLISVLEELKNIKEEFPNITLERAIKICEMYQRVFKYLAPKYRNKFKTKIWYYWYKNFEDDMYINQHM